MLTSELHITSRPAPELSQASHNAHALLIGRKRSDRLRFTQCDRHSKARKAADMLGNLVAQTATSRHAELDVLRPVTHAAQRPINRICR